MAKRKKNPGTAVWLILGLAAGGGLIFAASQGAFDQLLEPKKAKKNGKKTNGKEEPQTRPPKEKPEPKGIDTGLWADENCELIEEVNMDTMQQVLPSFVETRLSEDDPELHAQALTDTPILLTSDLTLAYLEIGKGTTHCLPAEITPVIDEETEDLQTIDGLTQFEAALFVFQFSIMTAYLAMNEYLSDEAFVGNAMFIATLAQQYGVTREYAEEIGFPAQAVDAALPE